MVVALSMDQAVFVRDGEVMRSPGLPPALVDGVGEIDALVEGSLTSMALKSGEGSLPPMTGRRAATPPDPAPGVVARTTPSSAHGTMTSGGRSSAAHPASAGARRRHAFVATDLLWLDGTPLADMPLLERKRLLEGALEASYLVRVAPFVRPRRS